MSVKLLYNNGGELVVGEFRGKSNPKIHIHPDRTRIYHENSDIKVKVNINGMRIERILHVDCCIKIVNLDSQHLVELDLKIFNKVEQLNVSNCGIERLLNAHINTQIKVLYLDYNPLIFQQGLVNFPARLETLSITNCNIANLRNLIFPKSLLYLRIKNNDIQKLNSGDLPPYLETLIISQTQKITHGSLPKSLQRIFIFEICQKFSDKQVMLYTFPFMYCKFSKENFGEELQYKIDYSWSPTIHKYEVNFCKKQKPKQIINCVFRKFSNEYTTQDVISTVLILNQCKQKKICIRSKLLNFIHHKIEHISCRDRKSAVFLIYTFIMFVGNLLILSPITVLEYKKILSFKLQIIVPLFMGIFTLLGVYNLEQYYLQIIEN